MLYNCARTLLEDFQKTWEEQLPAPPSAEDVKQSLAKKKGAAIRGRKEKSSATEVDVGVEESDDDPDVVYVAVASAPATVPMKRKPARERPPSPKDESSSGPVSNSSPKELRARISYLQKCRPAVQSRAPVPPGSGYLSLAALLYEFPMEFQQKRKCKSGMNRVPDDKLEVLFHMINSSSGNVHQSDEDFEVDMDRLDNKTMRNIEAFLEQFVSGFKTVRSSTLGREFNTMEEVDDEIKSVQLTLTRVTK